MADEGSRREAETLCPDCGKRIVGASRAGSLTSYLFQPFNCTCSKSRAKGPRSPGAGPASAKAGPHPRLDSDIVFCPDCGLKRAAASQIGSFTGFLFQSTRCKCAPKEQSGDGEMAKKFWKLRQADGGATFDGAAMAAPDRQPEGAAIVGLKPGAVIGGAYRIIRFIDRGGMGEVYLAQHLALNKTCALKVIPPDQVTDDGWQRFQNEAKAIAALDHINLVKVTDLGVHEGCLPFYAMEYVEGKTLAEMLGEHGPMPLPTVLSVFMQICDGVDYAHRIGLIHRDLKPANIMLAKSQDGQHAVKILDFGLVKLIRKDRHQQSLTAVGDVFGTPYYMSPEQGAGDKVDNRADIYSLGCVLFEALTGRPPFYEGLAVAIMINHQMSDPPTLDSRVGPNVFPESMEVVLAKLLRKNPVERYQTLRELRGDLEKVARGGEVAPFFISRTKQSAGGSDEKSDGEKIDRGARSAPLTSAVSKLPGFMVTVKLFVAFAAIFALGLFVINHPYKQAPSARVDSGSFVFPVKPDVKDSSSKNIDAVENPSLAELTQTTPFSTVQIINGKLRRVFKFPERFSLGTISTRGQLDSREARSTQDWPKESHLCYWPGFTAVEYSDCLKRFQKGDIYSARPGTNGMFNNFDSAEASLKALTNIPGLRALDLFEFPPFVPETMQLLSDFPTVDSLAIGQSNMGQYKVEDLAILPQLRELTLVSFHNFAAISSKLRQCPRLETLLILGKKNLLADVAHIATISNLKSLELRTSPPYSGDEMRQIIPMLLRMSGLKSLALDMSLANPRDIRALDGMKKLTYLNVFSLSEKSDALAAAQMGALSKIDTLKELEIDKLSGTEAVLSKVQSFKKLQRIRFIIALSKDSLTDIKNFVNKTSGLTLKQESNPSMEDILIGRTIWSDH